MTKIVGNVSISLAVGDIFTIIDPNCMYIVVEDGDCFSVIQVTTDYAHVVESFTSLEELNAEYFGQAIHKVQQIKIEH